MEIFVGISVKSVGKFRVNVRKSLIEYYDSVITSSNMFDNNAFRSLPSKMISQRVDSIKQISELTFRYNNYTFEIEIPKENMSKITVILTNLDTYESRLLNSDEFVVDTGISWANLFDGNGELEGEGFLQIPYIDLTQLCSLAKDIIIVSNSFYIRHGYNSDELATELADIMNLVVRNNNYIATIRNDHYTYQDIVNWLSAGRPVS